MAEDKRVDISLQGSPRGHISAYSNVQNVLVKLMTQPEKHLMLLNPVVCVCALNPCFWLFSPLFVYIHLYLVTFLLIGSWLYLNSVYLDEKRKVAATIALSPSCPHLLDEQIIYSIIEMYDQTNLPPILGVHPPKSMKDHVAIMAAFINVVSMPNMLLASPKQLIVGAFRLKAKRILRGMLLITALILVLILASGLLLGLSQFGGSVWLLLAGFLLPFAIFAVSLPVINANTNFVASQAVISQHLLELTESNQSNPPTV